MFAIKMTEKQKKELSRACENHSSTQVLDFSSKNMHNKFVESVQNINIGCLSRPKFLKNKGD